MGLFCLFDLGFRPGGPSCSIPKFRYTQKFSLERLTSTFFGFSNVKKKALWNILTLSTKSILETFLQSSCCSVLCPQRHLVLHCNVEGRKLLKANSKPSLGHVVRRQETGTSWDLLAWPFLHSHVKGKRAEQTTRKRGFSTTEWI